MLPMKVQHCVTALSFMKLQFWFAEPFGEENIL